MYRLFLPETRQKRGVKPNAKQIQLSSDLILIRLKAYISRNVIGDEAFYPILFKDDPSVVTAIRELNKKKYKIESRSRMEEIDSELIQFLDHPKSWMPLHIISTNKIVSIPSMAR